MRITPVDAGALAASTFLQSSFWAAFKASFGWKALAFGFQLDDDDRPRGLSVLLRRLPLGLSFAYVPHGPDCYPPAEEQGSVLVALARALRKELPKGCLFLRFDPAWHEREAPAADSSEVPAAEASGSAEPPLDAAPAARRNVARPVYGKPLRKGSDVQPPDTVLIDLSRSPEELLAGMKSKWRYNIKLAEKKGVTVSDEGLAALDEFYALYTATSKRDGIALHPKAYYRRLFELAAADMGSPRAMEGLPRADIRLWVARHEGQALAAIVTMFYGDEAVYLYGASGDEKRNLMPAYALQWAAMRAAKDAGCLRYDLYGIPPVEDPAHPMAGLYRFKTGFGGELLHYAGSWDYVYRPLIYAILRSMERARLWWHKVLKKKMFLR
ncbi:MAG TPA: peptidoglycan bridge formation protein FemAB [Spirochaetaceae bacterium]|jgi:lipid II:glycine glycyltransferase (peptidoglycan interpeptide bridge formation enzyme)|nr:peptidoglycan bridge formation protein FemAB [Spirochaetaceae bacterium]